MTPFAQFHPLEGSVHSCILHGTPLVTAQIFDNDPQAHEYIVQNVNLNHPFHATVVQS